MHSEISGFKADNKAICDKKQYADISKRIVIILCYRIQSNINTDKFYAQVMLNGFNLCSFFRRYFVNRFELKYDIPTKTFNVKIDGYSKKGYDCINFTSQDICYCLVGCVLNVESLLKEYSCIELNSLIEKLWAAFNFEIVNIIKGNYIITTFNKVSHEVFVSNDKLSKHPLFYFHNKTEIICSDSFTTTVNILKDSGDILHADELGMGMLLEEGLIWNDITLVEEIKYLEPYRFIRIKNDTLDVAKVEIKNKYNKLSFKKAVDEFNNLFLAAVRLQYQKNQNNDYLQLAALSGGMDSRACLLCAINEGFKNIESFTYSQTGAPDEVVPAQISGDYNIKNTFLPLDDAEFVFEFNDTAYRNDFMQSYTRATGLIDVIKKFDSSKYFVIHTGLFGGELLGDAINKLKFFTNNDEPFNYFTKNSAFFTGVSAKYAESLSATRSDYISELFKLLRGCNAYMRAVSDSFESFSPFLDEDVFEFVLGLNKKYLINRRLYSFWMNKYIPNKYYTTYYMGSVDSGTIRYYCKLISDIIDSFFIHKKRKQAISMNPFEQWEKQIEKYSDRVIEAVMPDLEYCKQHSKELYNEVVASLKRSGEPKLFAVTLLKAISELDLLSDSK